MLIMIERQCKQSSKNDENGLGQQLINGVGWLSLGYLDLDIWLFVLEKGFFVLFYSR